MYSHWVSCWGDGYPRPPLGAVTAGSVHGVVRDIQLENIVYSTILQVSMSGV